MLAGGAACIGKPSGFTRELSLPVGPGRVAGSGDLLDDHGLSPDPVTMRWARAVPDALLGIEMRLSVPCIEKWSRSRLNR